MRKLKQYWQSLFTGTNKSANTHAHTSPGPDKLEQEIAVLNSENQTLAANLEEIHQEIAATRNTDADRFAELERANHALETTRQAEIERLAELERRFVEVAAERHQAHDQIEQLKTSLTAASTRLEKTDIQVRQLELEHRAHEQLQLETQTRLRTQDQRLSWTMMVAGFAVVLATVAGAVFILELHKNATLLGSMNADMQHLISSMDQHLETGDQATAEIPSPATELTPPPTTTVAATRDRTAEMTDPGAHSEAVPEAAPAAALETVQETEPEAAPAAALETAQETEPKAAPAAVPKAAPAAVPEAAPAAIPEAVDDAADSAATPAYLPSPTIPADGQQHSQMLSATKNNRVFTEAGVDWTMGNLPSGILFRVETPGKGQSPNISDRVVVNYLATSPDGKIIDDTYSSGQPATLHMSELGPVLQEALLNMGEGAEWEVTVPEQQPNRETPGPMPGLYLIELVAVIKGEVPAPSRPSE